MFVLSGSLKICSSMPLGTNSAVQDYGTRTETAQKLAPEKFLQAESTTLVLPRPALSSCLIPKQSIMRNKFLNTRTGLSIALPLPICKFS